MITHRFNRLISAFGILLVVLTGCTGQQAALSPTPLPAAAAPSRAGVPAPEAVLAASDLPLDPEIRSGRLDNGLFYVIRPNGTPEGTAEVRLRIDAGSLDELGDEQGFAHFVEHMAFNGSKNVPEGEMIRLLQRKGLAFGADTNASTGFEATTYILRLPQNDPALLDTALMLMRETAGELLFELLAVERERGVVLAEMRDRKTYAYDEAVDRYRFETPNSRHVQRLPIGTAETIDAATGASLRAFWQKHYRPENASIVVVGDFPSTAVETAIRTHFAGWHNPAPQADDRDYGYVDPDHAGATEIYLNPALAERIVAARAGPALPEPDTVAARREGVLRSLAYAIINRRFKRMARKADAPFTAAGMGTGDVFRIGRVTRLVVDTAEGRWHTGLDAAVGAYRQALTNGFTQAEVDEQWSRLVAAHEAAAAGEDTRRHRDLVQQVVAWIDDGQLPTTPSSGLARLNAMAHQVTPESVMAALRREAIPLDRPNLRFRGRTAPEGGAAGIRLAWDAAMAGPVGSIKPTAPPPFAYDDFGPAGQVVMDGREPIYGIRTIRFANNVRLNLKRTELDKDSVTVRLLVDGGKLLATRENPLAVTLASRLPDGGLGAHNADELDTILAARTVSLGLDAAEDAFTSTRTTTRRDLGLQMRLLAALVRDPGWRPEPVERFRAHLPDWFAKLDATPASALATAQGGILSDGDPRFTQQPIDAYRKLGFDQLRETMSSSLARGAIEIGIVGDIDEDATIALVAETFGALKPRDATFAERAEARQRSFTHRRGPVIVRHRGEADQALIRMVWPTTDDGDAVLAARLELLERVAKVLLTDEIRERLGRAYSTGASSAMSHVYPGWGTFALTMQVDLEHLASSRAAIAAVLARLRSGPVDADMLTRAREPLLDGIDNALKSNRGWIALADRAQSEPERIARFASYRERIEAVTAEDLLETARYALPAGGAVELIAISQDADDPFEEPNGSS